MTIDLLAFGSRARTSAVLVVLAAAVIVTAPAPEPAAAAGSSQLLSQGVGMRAEPSLRVRAVQRALARRGYDLGPPGVDGRFGRLTDSAVRRLQADRGLAVDGLVGPRTRRVLGVTAAAREPALRRRAQRERTASEPRRPDATRGSAVAPPGPAQAPQRPRVEQPPDRFEGPIIAGVLAAAFVVGLWWMLAVARPRRRHRAAIMAADADDIRGVEMSSENVTGPPMAPAVQQRRPQPVQAVTADAAGAVGPSAGLESGQAVLGYVAVAEDPGDGDVDASAAAIDAACERAGWRLTGLVRDRANGPALDRPGLRHALERIASGEAQALMVGDIRLLTASTVDLGDLLVWFRDTRAVLIALDLGLDTSTPEGRGVATTLITLGAWERERIARRARLGLTGAGSAGKSSDIGRLELRPQKHGGPP